MKFSLFSKLHWILGVLILVTGLMITGVSSRWLQEDKTNVLQELTVQVSASGSRQLAERIRNSLNRAKNESRDLSFTLAKRAAGQAWDFSTVSDGVIKVDRLKELLTVSDLKYDENFLSPFAGTKGEPLVLIAHLIQGRSVQDADAKLQVVIEPIGRWDDLVRPFKGAFTSLFFVDDHGHTFLHPNETYIGHTLNQNVAVQSVMTASRRLFTGSLKNESGDALFVSYERVPKTNLVSISTVSLKTAYGSSKVMIFFIMAAMTLLAAVVVAVCRAQWKIREDVAMLPPEPLPILNGARASFDLEDESPRAAVTAPTPAAPVGTAPVSTALLSTAPPVDTERLRRLARLEAIESLGRKLAKEFQGAIAATLGHLQLAKGKIESRDTLKHVEFIDREIRQIKETLERMGRMGVYQTLELSTAKPLEVLSDILNEAEVTTARWSVQIRQNFFPVADFRINESEFKKAINELILNRARAMEHACNHDLVVTVEPFENKVRIRIEDHAPALSMDVAQKFFDFGERVSSLQAPFDLRLPVVGAVLGNHGATIRVNPSTGEEHVGNQIIIELPVFFEDKKSSAHPNGDSDASLAALQKEQVKLSTELRDLNFTESAQDQAPDETTDRSASAVKVVRAVKPTELPSAPPAPEGPLTGFSVKVRRPRMTL